MIKDARFLNFTKLFFSNASGQFIALLLYPYIAREYSPEDFARFGLFVSTVNILSVFATGQLHAALLNPEDDEEARELVGMTVSLVAIFSAILFTVLFFYDKSLILISVYIFVYSLFDIERMIFLRNQSYNEAALSQGVYRLFGNGSKLFPFFVQINSHGLILSELLALVFVVGYGVFKGFFHFKWNLKLLKKYRSFPIYHTLTMSTYLLLSDFPILLWATKFSGRDIGIFVMAQKLLIVPAQFISGAVQNSTIHQIIASKKPAQEMKKILFILGVLGFVGTIVFYTFGIDFLLFVLGPTWASGENVFLLISLMFATKFIFALVQSSFILRSATKILFISRVVQIGFLGIVSVVEFDFYTSLKFYVFIDILVDISLTLYGVYSVRSPFIFRSNKLDK
jgi:O-antigen/teichoic acid export membrane protein